MLIRKQLRKLPTTAGLEEFGLNPKEWSLLDTLKVNKKARILVNTKDPQFCLRGYFGNKGWIQLEVISL